MTWHSLIGSLSHQPTTLKRTTITHGSQPHPIIQRKKEKVPRKSVLCNPFRFSFSRLAHRVATRPRDIIITPILPIPSSSDCINSAMVLSRKSKLPQRNNLFASGFSPCFFSETRVCVPTLFLFSSKWQRIETPPLMGCPERPP